MSHELFERSFGVHVHAAGPYVHVAKPMMIGQAEMASAAWTTQFTEWNPQMDCYWDIPSNLNLYPDGSWFLFARRLANMRRVTPILDGGDRYNFRVRVVYFDGPVDGAGQATGAVVHVGTYDLATLDYKEERWDAESHGTDHRLRAVWDDVQSGVFTREIS